MKKILALVLALVMVLAVAVASAATITIEPQKPTTAGSETTQPVYTYYVMMKASVSGSAVSYYVEDQTHADALNGLTVGGDDLFTVTKAAGADRWNVTINKKANGSDFTGIEVADALKTIKTTNYGTGTATAGDNGKSTIDLTSDGYVLIESSLGTALIVDTYTTETVQEKNTYPGNTKTEDKSNAEIGEVVTYTVEVNIPATVAEKPIKVVDTITKGLTMNTAITVTGDTNSTYTSATFVKNNELSNDNAAVYEVEIPKETVLANAGGKLTLTYTATVNELAVVDTDEKNDAHIVYDRFTTQDVEVKVKTFGFDLEKVDKDNHDTKLEGVTFTLVNGDGQYYTIPSNASSIDEDRFVALESGATAPTVATDSNGKVTFAGLHQGIYTLTEISNPNAGYNMLTSAITITVDADGTVTADGATVQSKVVTVENGKGTVLPSTGGIGTTIFYILGGVLVIGAAVILVARRKAHE